MSARPLLIQNLAQPGQAMTGLEPVSLEKPPYDEDWLQNLIHAHPELVPAGEVEACFDNLVPVLREFSLPSGYLDNLYITPDGYPVLVEVKLWKNQEARRKVIAQILEYAKDFAALFYEDINSEIRKQIRDRKWGQNPLHEIVSESVSIPPDERLFVDRVSRNLREGRFLLLILGDGIREDMAALADYLMHHSLRYAFGMVEIRLFTMPDGNVLALPQVLARTQTIERHVTVVSTQSGEIEVKAPASVVSETVEKTSLSTDEFYELMAKNDPQNVVWFKDLLGRLSDLPVDIQPGSRGESLMLKVPVPESGQMQLMLITPTSVQFWGVPNKQWKNPEWQRLSRAYLERIVSLVPEADIKTFATMADIKLNDKPLPIDRLHGKAEEVAQAMRTVLQDMEGFYASHEDEQAA